MSAHRPIEILGGGLAGLSLGLALRRAGVEVDLYDAGDYPRHRVCGEFIAGLDQPTIRTLGLGPFLDDALRHREVAWHTGNGRIAFQKLPAPALGISRYRLDHRLASAFVAAGGSLHLRTRVADCRDRPGRVIAIGRVRGRSDWVGLKLHVPGLELERDLELHLGSGAYVGLSRVENGRVNVCGLFKKMPGGTATSRSAVFVHHLRAAGILPLADRIEQARPDPDSYCAVAGLRFDGRVRPGPGVRLGDAAAMIPPFTGNGMAMAFQSAAAALGPLLDYSRGLAPWSEAEVKIRRALSRRFRLRLASAGALHSWLLHPARRRLLGAAGQRHLIPFRPLYALLH